MTGYIYLVHEREFINTKQHIYKIGRTENAQQRMCGYPKNSRLMLSLFTVNHVDVEIQLIDIFHKKFKHCDNIGHEYFMGDFAEMMHTIVDYVNRVNDFHEIPTLTDKENILLTKTQQAMTKPVKEPVVKPKFIDSKRSLTEYVNINRNELSNTTVKCYEFFDNFNKWLSSQGYKEFNNMQQIIQDLHQMYLADTTSYIFDTGRDLAIVFPNLLTTEKDTTLYTFDKFVEQYIERAEGVFFTLKQAKALYINTPFCDGRIHALKEKLVIALNTPCLPQKNILGNNTKNVFYGYKLKTL